MKRVLVSSLMFFLLACGLSTQEELVLSKAVGDYVDAVNENQVLIKLGLSHPRVVKHYSDQGKDTVQKYFDLEKYSIFNYVKDKSWDADQSLCIRYQYKKEDHQHYFYAVKKEGQKNWLFIDERDTFLFPELFEVNN
ncbi:hypothetical protein [Lishizhenia sp.]|uniref:hypothetical protein n=1 Tax=Lishizhenia sp. TaxID=2497594 RepID=UPI00299F064B|nr:hypothetical protein [Lishizhenia sp.]MDX1446418.1 hypothetical protein [Lishizhenia sp.]